MFIKGENIGIRAMESQDVALLYQWENDTQLWPVSNSQTPFNHFTLETFVNASHQDIYTNKQLRLMICSPDNDITIGVIDLYEFDPQHARAGIGIYIHKNFRGNGFAAEAVKKMLDYAFNILHLKQVYTHINIDNQASLALFESCGFEKSGLKKYWHKTGLDSYTDVWFLQCYNAS